MTTAITPIEEIQNSMQKINWKDALPSNIDADKFIRVAMTTIRMNPALTTVDRTSLYGELQKCASDGLVPDGREACIVPIKGKAKYIAMIAGKCKRARNSGEIASIDAQDVYANDKFDAWIDEKGQHFKHVKAVGPRGELVRTYAYCITKDGGFYFEDVDKESMDSIKKFALSKLSDDAKKFSPWCGPFEGEQRRKTAIGRLTKYRVPSSSDLNTQLHDDPDEDVPPTPFEPEAATPTEPKPTRLETIVAAKTPVKPEPAEAELVQPQADVELPL